MTAIQEPSDDSRRSLECDSSPAAAPSVREIGSRRELFVDRYLVSRLENTTLRLHAPQLAPEMTEPPDPLEYGAVIRDGDSSASTRAMARLRVGLWFQQG